MDPIELTSLVISLLAGATTGLSVYYANSPTSSARLVTVLLKSDYAYPHNKLGPETFQRPIHPEYLNLEIVNSGPGIAKKIEWNIHRSDTGGSEDGKIPSLGSGGAICVREFVEKIHCIQESETVFYTVTVGYKRIFDIFRSSIIMKFDGLGHVVDYSAKRISIKWLDS